MNLDNIEISQKLNQLYINRFGKRIGVRVGGNDYHVFYSGSGKLIVINLKTMEVGDGREFLGRLPANRITIEEIRKKLLL